MLASLLSNYLISNRKRLGLSQEDVAFLLGSGTGAKVSRHERFVREPGLLTAFAYEAIYRRSASELFAGLYSRVEREVAARAKDLLSKGAEPDPRRKAEPRYQALRAIADQAAELTS